MWIGTNVCKTHARQSVVCSLMQLCLDIFLVREAREFALEEELYSKLIFLYRSPSTLIKLTKID